ncbi:hypothetical protein GQ600_3430 [Phytophthora cactorum]|nr:hypothetical protein GQ600_3430 [Phytophthora cactorum]
MKNKSSASVNHGIPILEDSVWSDSQCSWDDPTTANAAIFTEGAVFIAGVLRLKWRLSRNLFSVPIPSSQLSLASKLVTSWSLFQLCSR